MGNKNYGAGVSGYLDPTGRNFETVVFQAGKPVVDSELNLTQELRASPGSGWISPEILRATSNADFLLMAGADYVLLAPLMASINGWDIVVNQTGIISGNRLNLTAGPTGAGAHRTDLIVLEVWRRLLSPIPSTDGKSPQFRIYKNGNVKLYDLADPTLDLNENFSDDLIDSAVGTETTKRVQLQYRLRVIPNVDLMTYPQGLDDPTVDVRSVPVSATSPDGAIIPTMSWANLSSEGEPGLWRAGDGNPMNALGTVDGFIYATPLCAIFRRNRTVFDKNTNHNGGELTPGPSTRPDGLYADVAVPSDIADLRYVINPNGWDYTEVLEKNVNMLLDNTVCAEWMTTAIGGGTWGHTVLFANEIGLSTANGGDGVVTGDTPGAEFVGEFDSVRREFSDRPVFEIATIRIPCPGASWTAGTVVIVSPSALEIYPYAPINWAAFAPSECTWADVTRARYEGHDGAHHCLPADITTITNLGTRPQGAISVTIGTVNPIITNEDLMLDILIAYPSGRGLTKTPVADFGANSLVINNPAQLPATAPVRYDSMIFALDYPHREASLRYRTGIYTVVLSADQETNPSPTVVLPERAINIIAVAINGVTPAVWTLSPGGRTLTINPMAVSGDYVYVTFQAVRPLPQNGEQVTIWYDMRAPQTIRGLNLPSPLTLVPRCVSAHVHTLTVGSGSMDEAYPYPVGYVQTGGVKVAAGDLFTGDHELDAKAHIAVANFDSDTGWMRLPSYVPMVAPADGFTFTRPGGAGEVDAESRTYYSTAVSGYLPNAYAQNLSDPKKHKVFVPVLAELSSDSGIGKSRQLVLLLLTRWASFDAVNGVFFDSTAATNTTTASVYRLRGNLLNGRI
jgi:hypothetical protein